VINGSTGMNTTIGTSQTRVYEVGPITATSTSKYLIMANTSFVIPSMGPTIQLTVGRATTSGASNVNSINIVSDGSSSLVLPVTSPCYYMASWPAMGDSGGDPVHLHGFVTDTPGAGTFYYTIWMSSSQSASLTSMAAILTVLLIRP
jgi:hypothetical protein